MSNPVPTAAERPTLRPIAPTDHADVLMLNDHNVSALAPLEEERLVELVRLADRADVVELAGEFAGFVITFGPGSTYDSENYRWFADKYGDAFYYLDRIVLSDRFRRRRLGSFAYDEIEAAAATYGRLALEVNLKPRNDASIAFHEGRGFVEVAQMGHGGKPVSLMVKELA